MKHPTIRLEFRRREKEDMRARAGRFREQISRRRSVRHFSADPLPSGVLEDCIRAAGSAPSGAHRQPWTFCVVTNPDLKRRIREAAEQEERRLYEERISDEWREALAPIGTDASKPFLETAPALIIVMRHGYELEDGGGRQMNYYTQESVGIAVGFLLAALHHAGLATLTHTPSPMGFLGDLLGRPPNERAYVLIPVGFPADDCRVPDLHRKPLDEILVQFD